MAEARLLASRDSQVVRPCRCPLGRCRCGGRRLRLCKERGRRRVQRYMLRGSLFQARRKVHRRSRCGGDEALPSPWSAMRDAWRRLCTFFRRGSGGSFAFVGRFRCCRRGHPVAGPPPLAPPAEAPRNRRFGSMCRRAPGSARVCLFRGARVLVELGCRAPPTNRSYALLATVWARQRCWPGGAEGGKEPRRRHCLVYRQAQHIVIEILFSKIVSMQPRSLDANCIAARPGARAPRQPDGISAIRKRKQVGDEAGYNARGRFRASLAATSQSLAAARPTKPGPRRRRLARQFGSCRHVPVREIAT